MAVTVMVMVTLMAIVMITLVRYSHTVVEAPKGLYQTPIIPTLMEREDQVESANPQSLTWTSCGAHSNNLFETGAQKVKKNEKQLTSP